MKSALVHISFSVSRIVASPPSYREAAAMGTPRPCNRSRTAGTSGYSRTFWPSLSRTVPSLERAREHSAPAGFLLAPVLPILASPAFVERGIYVRVHPERPERVIYEEGGGRFSLGGAGTQLLLGSGKGERPPKPSLLVPHPDRKRRASGAAPWPPRGAGARQRCGAKEVAGPTATQNGA
jgi:hypothetical protein